MTFVLYSFCLFSLLCSVRSADVYVSGFSDTYYCEPLNICFKVEEVKLLPTPCKEHTLYVEFLINKVVNSQNKSLVLRGYLNPMASEPNVDNNIVDKKVMAKKCRAIKRYEFL